MESMGEKKAILHVLWVYIIYNYLRGLGLNSPVGCRRPPQYWSLTLVNLIGQNGYLIVINTLTVIVTDFLKVFSS